MLNHCIVRTIFSLFARGGQLSAGTVLQTSCLRKLDFLPVSLGGPDRAPLTATHFTPPTKRLLTMVQHKKTKTRSSAVDPRVLWKCLLTKTDGLWKPGWTFPATNQLDFWSMNYYFTKCARTCSDWSVVLVAPGWVLLGAAVDGVGAGDLRSSPVARGRSSAALDLASPGGEGPAPT